MPPSAGSAIGGLTSAAGIIALLDEDENQLKVYALKKLNEIADVFWAEISDSVIKIEELYEDESFPARELAALVVSKVYYHLGDYGDALQFALNAGQAFEVNAKDEYVHTMISNAIDNYTTQRKAQFDGKEITINPALEDICNRMFQRCFSSKEYKQAIGVAIEARRADMLEKAIVDSGDLPTTLAYVFNAALNLLNHRPFRKATLAILARLYQTIENPDYNLVCQCYVLLNQPQEVANVLGKLLEVQKEPLATQLAFDLYELATQQFLLNVRTSLTAKAPVLPTDTEQPPSYDSATAPLSVDSVNRLNSILQGEVTLPLYVEFLSRNNDADKQILINIRDSQQRDTICHSATVMANIAAYAGTTSDVFLRENGEWLQKATNWAKFNVVAGLGVIHKGHTSEAMTVLDPYLPKDDAGDSMYTQGGSLYALGLIFANQGESVLQYLLSELRKTQVEVVQHGACLGIGLAGLGSLHDVAYEQLKTNLWTDSAVAGEAAGLSMGLVMLGSADNKVIGEMFQYAQDTEHEKIIRGLSLGMSFVMYGSENQADDLIEKFMDDKDPNLRMAGCFTIATAYVGTHDNKAISKLLHKAVSDVNDDVRRAAVTCLGFLLFRSPEQVPSIVALLSESFNPHVRVGACMALGIACAGTGLAEAIALIEPMTNDPVAFVRQGAFIAYAMIMMQQPMTHPKAKSVRDLYVKTMKDKHEDKLAKLGAIYAQGIIDAGGRNVTIQLSRSHGHVDMPSVVGLLVFSQFWYWFPFSNFLSLALRPTAVICLNQDLKMPKIELISNAPPSTFAYPPKLETKKTQSKEKVSTAVLSITSKKQRGKKAEEGAESMEVDSKDEPSKEAEEAEKKKVEEEEEKKEPEKEADFLMIPNPARAVPAQLPKISFPDVCRYRPVVSGPLTGGVVILEDSTPGEEEELIEVAQPASAGGPADAETNEPEPPEPFEFNLALENGEMTSSVV